MNFTSKKSILKFIRNKYLIAATAFIVWMAFFDPKDIASTYERSKKLKVLKQNEKHLNDDIKHTKNELSLLKSNAETIETYARENFYMKKDNEDLFIVK